MSSQAVGILYYQFSGHSLVGYVLWLEAPLLCCRSVVGFCLYHPLAVRDCLLVGSCLCLLLLPGSCYLLESSQVVLLAVAPAMVPCSRSVVGCVLSQEVLHPCCQSVVGFSLWLLVLH